MSATSPLYNLLVLLSALLALGLAFYDYVRRAALAAVRAGDHRPA